MYIQKSSPLKLGKNTLFSALHPFFADLVRRYGTKILARKYEIVKKYLRDVAVDAITEMTCSSNSRIESHDAISIL